MMTVFPTTTYLIMLILTLFCKSANAVFSVTNHKEVYLHKNTCKKICFGHVSGLHE